MPSKQDLAGDSMTVRKTVLVAVDETDASERVAQFVNRFFSPGDTELVGLNVAEEPRPWLPPTVGWGATYSWGYPGLPPAWTSPADELAADAQEQAERAVVRSGLTDAVAVGEVGDPVDAIIRAAEARDVDLIVLGSNHRNVLQRVFERSVSKTVVKIADRPVLVVP